MLQIQALRLEINTTNGLYGTFQSFGPGLNIVRANNTSGKSTIFQAILYALGFEELIGGKNEKTMQSVLKDSVLDGDKQYNVMQSLVALQISNGKNEVTIKRSVVNEKRKSQLIDVISGPALTDLEGNYSLRQMYLHDKGSASDETYGFHAFLEEFLGWKLPNVFDNSGNSTKLYIPLIAPAFIIEQKSGWSSLFETMPFYGIKNAEERVVEFLLNLDVFQNEQSKISLNIEKRLIADRWLNLSLEFKRLGGRSSGEVTGMTEFPMIVNNISEVYFRFTRSNKSYLITELIAELQDEYEEIAKETEITVGENLEKNQARLIQLSDNLIRYNHRLEQLENEIFIEKDQLKQYIIQKRNVEEDLVNNKSAKKMLAFGADIQSPIAENKCPTCSQSINGTLLPPEVNQSPMGIDNNIDFLTSQLKMLEVFVNGQRKKVNEKDTLISELRNYVQNLRQQTRSIKKDLVSDERLPSEELIERKINLRKLIKLYEDVSENTLELKNRLVSLSSEWEKIKSKESALAKDFFSAFDRDKLELFQTKFIKLLSKFNYQSKERDAIRISNEKYVPVIEIIKPNEKPKFYDIRFDSSGSDHIRSMWAYYVSLLETSIAKSGNHPRLLMLDEPQQQSASTKDFHEFLKELSLQKDAQTIVFASFQNSQLDFEAATKELDFLKIETNKRFISKFDNDLLIDFN